MFMITQPLFGDYKETTSLLFAVTSTGSEKHFTPYFCKGNDFPSYFLFLSRHIFNFKHNEILLTI